MATGSLFSVSC